MRQPTTIEITDASGKPKVKLDLPEPLRIGDTITLSFRLHRKNGGRDEALDVVGKYRVTSVSIDASTGIGRQALCVESTGTSPHWKAIKKIPPFERRLGPTEFHTAIHL